MIVESLSGSDPSCISQCPGAMPCGKKIPIKRGFGFAAVWASAVDAGIMASNKGRANVTPAPFRNVRRGKCFRVINILIGLLVAAGTLNASLKFHIFSEWLAPHDA